MRDFIRITLGCIFILGVIYGGVKFLNDREDKKWNNGICECGGHYEYEQAIGHKEDTAYIYKCDTCGKHIELWEER